MDAENRKNLKELIKILQKSGAKRFKCAEFEIELTPEFRPKRASKSDFKDPIAPMLPESDLLFWSSSPAGIN